MRSIINSIILLVAVCLALVVEQNHAFVPQGAVKASFGRTKTTTQLPDFLGEKERETLTRDSEPEEFFAT